MKMNIQTLGIWVLSALALSACGEQFTGQFYGRANVVSNCQSGNPVGSYQLEMEAALSEGRAAMRITNLAPEAGPGDINLINAFIGRNINASVANHTIIFTSESQAYVMRSSAQNAIFQNVDINSLSDPELAVADIVTADGFVNLSRDRMTALRLEVTTLGAQNNNDDVFECSYGILAPELILE